MKFTLLFLGLLSVSVFSIKAAHSIEIGPYRNMSWDNSWNASITNEIENHESLVMMTSQLDKNDLMELNCPGFNSASDESKKDFWVVFISALVRAESAFNVKAKSLAPKGRHGNYGLLQLSRRTAREQCGLDSPDQIATGKEQVKCGVKLLSWQLQGAPTSAGKLSRPDLKGQLFGKRILLWGPLRKNDPHGRKLLVGWFKKHLDQMPFCQSS